MNKSLSFLKFYVLVFIITFLGLNRTFAGISIQPQNVEKCATTSTTIVSFGISTSLFPTATAYQWQIYDKKSRIWANLTDGAFVDYPAVNGSNTHIVSFAFGKSTVPLSVIHNGLTVRVIVSFGKFGTETSTSGVLTVLTAANISSQPVSADRVVGESVSFSVSATGSNLTYQWYKNGLIIFGATTSSFNIPSCITTDAGSYTCEVSNSCNSILSSAAILGVYQVLLVNSKYPANASSCEGEAVINFNVDTKGPVIGYQWQKLPYKSEVWEDVPSGSGGTLNPLTLTFTKEVPLTKSLSGTQYRCIVYGSAGQSVISNAAILTVLLKPAIYSNPVGAVKISGESMTFNVGATGAAPLYYQWQKDGSNIPGATASSYTIGVLDITHSGTYRCLVSNGCYSNVSSTGAVLTVTAPLYPEAWFIQDASTGLDLTDVSSPSNLTVYALQSGNSDIRKTINGGETWSVITTGSSTWKCIEFINSNSGLVGGDNRVDRTTNGGGLWTPYTVNTGLVLGGAESPSVNSIEMISADTVYAVGSKGLIMKSSDGGVSWVKNSFNGTPVTGLNVDLYAVSFSGFQHGWAVGVNGFIARTSNFGKTWTLQKNGAQNWVSQNILSVEAVSSTNAFILTANGGLWKTTNGGSSWSQVNYAPIVIPKSSSAIQFVDANNGYIVGEQSGSTGVVLKTNNGGVDWYSQKMEGTQVVYAIDMADANDGWIVGKAGQIHRTANGGCVKPIVSLYEDKIFCQGQSYQLEADTFTHNLNCTYLWNPGSTAGGKLTVSITNTYRVTLTNECGITATDSALITFQPLPIADAGETSTSICVGDTIQLMATGGGTYSWNNGAFLSNSTVSNPFAYPSGSTQFTVTVTNDFGCTSTDNIMVNVYSIPTSDFTAPDYVCGNNPVNFAYSGTPAGKTFNWIFTEGTPSTGTSSSHDVSWSTEGDKFIQLITTQNGCESAPVTKFVNVREVPTSTFDLPSTTCGSSPATLIYSGSAPSDANYIWNFDGGTLVAGSGQGPLLVSWATKGTKNVTLSVSQNSCVSEQTSKSIIAAFPYDQERICLVTADLETGKNMVVWEKTANVGTHHYIVYREGSTQGVYDTLAIVPFDSLSVYVDMTSMPEQQQYKYKISVVDTCGNESAMSPWHKTMFLQWVSSTSGVNLNWQEYQIEGGSVSFASYAIFRGTASGTLSQLTTISSSFLAFTDIDPTALTKKMYYRVGGVKSVSCKPAVLLGKKANSGPFVHSLSNLEDNRLQATGLKDALSNSIRMSIYPNPFNESTNIRYFLEKPSKLQIEIYNVIGEKVKSLLNEKQGVGEYQIEINASDVGNTSGLYYLKFKVDEEVVIKKIMMNR